MADESEEDSLLHLVQALFCDALLQLLLRSELCSRGVPTLAELIELNAFFDMQQQAVQASLAH